MSLARIRLLVWKEFLQLRRDPLLLRLLFLMPIVQLVGFGYVVSVDVRNLPTAVVDLDQSVVSRQLEASFTASGYFAVVVHPASEAELQPLLNTAIAKADDPVAMGRAFRLAAEAGRAGFEAGLMGARDFASPSTPVVGTPFWHAVS